MLKWVNQQNPRSVLFVGVGSECKDQVYEIADGIELSKLPLWIVQKPKWSSTSSRGPRFNCRNITTWICTYCSAICA